MKNHTHPVLSCRQTLVLEQEILGDDEAMVWAAMNRAGRGIGDAILRDFQEVAPLPQDARILVLVGKGHNGGDALLAADQILRHYQQAHAHIIFVSDESELKPLVQRAWEDLQEVGMTTLRSIDDVDAIAEETFDICIDGLLGMQFKAPLKEPLLSLIKSINDCQQIRFRAAVDLPSGMGESCAEEPFMADFTYAAGTAKTPLFTHEQAHWVGRIRYIDVGFFDDKNPDTEGSLFLRPSILKKLQGPRVAQSDKRGYGHLFIVAGSCAMPGALMMSVQSALRSGVGLVTACAPESLVPALAARAPEAMWLPCPESISGTISDGAADLILEKLSAADALLMGPGMGYDQSTLGLLQQLLAYATVPMVLDADALHLDVIDALPKTGTAGRVILTPHAGEFARIAGVSPFVISDDDLKQFCREKSVCVLLKGPVSRISDGQRLIYSTFGGPILARGGSGDVLSGLLAGLLADGSTTLETACRAVAWHGSAADALARERGQTAVTVMDLLDYLDSAVRTVV